ncbi:MAG: VacJ family lipoprotein [Desulfovibrionaceae bacterium]
MKSPVLQILLCICLLLPVCGCAKKAAAPAVEQSATATEARPAAPAPETAGAQPGDATFDDELDDYSSQPVAAISDPLEPWNRFWFAFNDIFYLHVAKPLYRGYVFITPQEFRTGVSNFFHNLFFPVRFVNNILQGKFKAAGVEFGRFVINTTVGFGGLIDVAKGRKTIVPVDERGEDFGQTLGTWGVGHGFYIVWPFLGPSSLRETAGFLADSYTTPLAYVSAHPVVLQTGVSVGDGFSHLDSILETYESVKDSAVDPYVAAREAYIEYRNIRVAR